MLFRSGQLQIFFHIEAAEDAPFLGYELDAKITELSAKDQQFAKEYVLSVGPEWMQLREMGVGMNPNTNLAWQQTWAILDDMTRKMADVRSKDRQAIYDKAQGEIDRLKALNSEFSKEYTRFSKSAFKPTSSELRAYKGDLSVVSHSSWGSWGRRGYRHKTRRGRRLKGVQMRKPGRVHRRRRRRVSARDV